MNVRKKRLTLDLEPTLHQRLKAVSALRGVSMRRYCQIAIGKELDRESTHEVVDLPFSHESLNLLDALQNEIFGGKVMSGDSADLIRESRDSRAAH